MSSLSQETSPFPVSDTRDVSRIGRRGKPIRVLSFAGSGFDTAMQLGVVHALLVTRARMPDVVIGASAGAISAVALAEVLQAGDIDDPGPKVARFRQLFEAYRRAPGEILQALVPDPVQVDTQRPLETLHLPVHHKGDREGRADAVAARAGLINLYNTLLSVRLTIGTIARAVRCWLGFQAAKEVRNRGQRIGVWVGETVRAWLLLGTNLHKAATIVTPIIRAALPWARRDEGATAGELIFGASIWRTFYRLTMEGFWTIVLIAVWLVISGFAAALVTGVFTLLLQLARLTRSLVAALIVGTLIGSLVYVGITRSRRWRLVLPVLAGVVSLFLLIIFWAGVLALALATPLLLDAAYKTLSSPTTSPVAFQWPWQYPLSYWIGVPVLLVVVGAVAGVGLTRRKDLGQRILALYSIDEGLFHPDALRQFLVRVFDSRLYNGDRTDATIERALRDDNLPHDEPLDAKLIGDYSYADRPSPRLYTPMHRQQPTKKKTKQPLPIHVAVAVTDVASGELTTVPPYVHVVNALVAGVAKPPFFPAANIVGRYLMDATALTYEPTEALLNLLRDRNVVNEEAAAVHLYTVAPVPLSRQALGKEYERNGEPRRYTRLLEVLRRVFQLRRFRDATLERRLTELHTRAMPRDGTVFFRAQDRDFLRVWVYPIEPERPLAVNYLTLHANTEGRRRQTMAETVADGCRTALQVMIQPAIDAVAIKRIPDVGWVTGCRAAVERHFADQTPPKQPAPRLPGSAPIAPNSGPGVAEVCENCALYRAQRVDPAPVPRGAPYNRTLLAKDGRSYAPWWPTQEGREEVWTDPPHSTQHRPIDASTREQLQRVWDGVWPRPREGADPSMPCSTVSLLFSGGVFRGVFQVGVLNAISEVSMRPDIVAGASVGSITSAMAARAFVTPGASGRAALPTRQGFIQGLASAYLAIDRLILTDRFSDFIRGFTVRAAQARFSIREADRVMRRFDAANPWTFSRELRRVLAGLERLAYVSPFELRDVIEAFRRQQLGTGARLIERYFQELLDRAGVGQELLGSEPLERLINDYVLADLPPPGTDASHVSFQEFLNNGTLFFATATNLSEGRLQAWGEDQLGGVGLTLNLLQALLASSAFPSVFRRRWSWEVQSSTPYPEEYADGGVMDNLPLDAVARFLDSAATMELIQRRPRVPHLIFSASLETAPRRGGEGEGLDAAAKNWPRLWRRTIELAYNRKLNLFRRTQDNLRLIVNARGGSDPNPWIPLNLEVLTVIPNWLCPTLAFHPMLGFRRSQEAASIAHGCAATLLALGRRAGGPAEAATAAAWGIDAERLPSEAQCRAVDSFVPLEKPDEPGNCWYRPRVVCPFSRAGRQAIGAWDKDKTTEELHEIYTACGRITTHRPR